MIFFLWINAIRTGMAVIIAQIVLSSFVCVSFCGLLETAITYLASKVVEVQFVLSQFFFCWATNTLANIALESPWWDSLLHRFQLWFRCISCEIQNECNKLVQCTANQQQWGPRKFERFEETYPKLFVFSACFLQWLLSLLLFQVRNPTSSNVRYGLLYNRKKIEILSDFVKNSKRELHEHRNTFKMDGKRQFQENSHPSALTANQFCWVLYHPAWLSVWLVVFYDFHSQFLADLLFYFQYKIKWCEIDGRLY